MVVQVGRFAASPQSFKPTIINREDPELDPFAHLKCLHAEVAARHDLKFAYPEVGLLRPAQIDATAFQRHALITGDIGSGKSRLLTHMLRQLLECGRGNSGIIIETKLPAVREYVRLARHIGIPSRRVFLLSPSIPGAIFRFPIFDQNLPVKQAVDHVVDALEGSTGNQMTAIRRHDFLMSIGMLVALAGTGQSLDEVLRALLDSDYREVLRARVQSPADPFAWLQVERFLDEIKRWSKLALADAVGPAARLVRGAINDELLYASLCALNDPNRSVLRLEEFWDIQSLLIIHLDADISGLRSSMILAGLILKTLFGAAKRVEHPKRAVLACLDELPELSRFVGTELARILSQARSANLHLLLSTQHRSQLPTELRDTVHQCGVQASFRQDYREAVSLAQAAVAGSEPPLAQVTLAPMRTDDRLKSLRLAQWTHPVVDHHNRPLAITPALWSALEEVWGVSGVSLHHIYALAADGGIPRLYVKEPGTGLPIELGQYLTQLDGCRYWFDGPTLTLTAIFPKVKPERVVRRSPSEASAALARSITELPVQHALLSVDGRLQGIVQIADVPSLPHTPDDAAYLAEIIAINGQTRSETLATLSTRTERMRQLLDDGLTDSNEGAADGSRW